MATFKYFSDITGEAVELVRITSIANKEFAARWPGVTGMRFDGYQKFVGTDRKSVV